MTAGETCSDFNRYLITNIDRKNCSVHGGDIVKHCIDGIRLPVGRRLMMMTGGAEELIGSTSTALTF